MVKMTADCPHPTCDEMPPGFCFQAHTFLRCFSGTQSEITYEKLNELEYLEQFIMEVMRFYPAAPRVDRVANQDCEIEGYTVPKGTVVFFPIQYLHMSAEYWDDPERFDPARFVGQKMSKPKTSTTENVKIEISF